MRTKIIEAHLEGLWLKAAIATYSPEDITRRSALPGYEKQNLSVTLPTVPLLLAALMRCSPSEPSALPSRTTCGSWTSPRGKAQPSACGKTHTTGSGNCRPTYTWHCHTVPLLFAAHQRCSPDRSCRHS